MKLVVNCFGLIVGIAAIAYGATNLEHACSQSDMLDLGVWMVIHGALMAFFSAGTGLALLAGETGLMIYGCGQCLYGIFNLVWSIIGGIILWRDSRSCQTADPTFYYASMVIIIISYVMICCGCVASGKSQQERSDEGA